MGTIPPPARTGLTTRPPTVLERAAIFSKRRERYMPELPSLDPHHFSLRAYGSPDEARACVFAGRLINDFPKVCAKITHNDQHRLTHFFDAADIIRLGTGFLRSVLMRISWSNTEYEERIFQFLSTWIEQNPEGYRSFLQTDIIPWNDDDKIVQGWPFLEDVHKQALAQKHLWMLAEDRKPDSIVKTRRSPPCDNQPVVCHTASLSPLTGKVGLAKQTDGDDLDTSKRTPGSPVVCHTDSLSPLTGRIVPTRKKEGNDPDASKHTSGAPAVCHTDTLSPLTGRVEPVKQSKNGTDWASMVEKDESDRTSFAVAPAGVSKPAEGKGEAIATTADQNSSPDKYKSKEVGREVAEPVKPPAVIKSSDTARTQSTRRASDMKAETETKRRLSFDKVAKNFLHESQDNDGLSRSQAIAAMQASHHNAKHSFSSNKSQGPTESLESAFNADPSILAAGIGGERRTSPGHTEAHRKKSNESLSSLMGQDPAIAAAGLDGQSRFSPDLVASSSYGPQDARSAPQAYQTQSRGRSQDAWSTPQPYQNQPRGRPQDARSTSQHHQSQSRGTGRQNYTPRRRFDSFRGRQPYISNEQQQGLQLGSGVPQVPSGAAMLPVQGQYPFWYPTQMPGPQFPLFTEHTPAQGPMQSYASNYGEIWSGISGLPIVDESSRFDRLAQSAVPSSYLPNEPISWSSPTNPETTIASRSALASSSKVAQQPEQAGSFRGHPHKSANRPNNGGAKRSGKKIPPETHPPRKEKAGYSKIPGQSFEHGKRPSFSNPAIARDMKKLHVSAPYLSDNNLALIFGPFNPIQIGPVIPSKSGKYRWPFCFVTFETAEMAEQTRKELDLRPFDEFGGQIRVSQAFLRGTDMDVVAVPKPKATDTIGATSLDPFEAKSRANEKSSGSSTQHVNDNALNTTSTAPKPQAPEASGSGLPKDDKTQQAPVPPPPAHTGIVAPTPTPSPAPKRKPAPPPAIPSPKHLFSKEAEDRRRSPAPPLKDAPKSSREKVPETKASKSKTAEGKFASANAFSTLGAEDEPTPTAEVNIEEQFGQESREALEKPEAIYTEGSSTTQEAERLAQETSPADPSSAEPPNESENVVSVPTTALPEVSPATENVTGQSDVTPEETSKSDNAKVNTDDNADESKVTDGRVPTEKLSSTEDGSTTHGPDLDPTTTSGQEGIQSTETAPAESPAEATVDTREQLPVMREDEFGAFGDDRSSTILSDGDPRNDKAQSADVREDPFPEEPEGPEEQTLRASDVEQSTNADAPTDATPSAGTASKKKNKKKKKKNKSKGKQPTVESEPESGPIAESSTSVQQTPSAATSASSTPMARTKYSKYKRGITHVEEVWATSKEDALAQAAAGAKKVTTIIAYKDEPNEPKASGSSLQETSSPHASTQMPSAQQEPPSAPPPRILNKADRAVLQKHDEEGPSFQDPLSRGAIHMPGKYHPEATGPDFVPDAEVLPEDFKPRTPLPRMNPSGPPLRAPFNDNMSMFEKAVTWSRNKERLNKRFIAQGLWPEEGHPEPAGWEKVPKWNVVDLTKEQHPGGGGDASTSASHSHSASTASNATTSSTDKNPAESACKPPPSTSSPSTAPTPKLDINTTTSTAPSTSATGPSPISPEDTVSSPASTHPNLTPTTPSSPSFKTSPKEASPGSKEARAASPAPVPSTSPSAEAEIDDLAASAASLSSAAGVNVSVRGRKESQRERNQKEKKAKGKGKQRRDSGLSENGSVENMKSESEGEGEGEEEESFVSAGEDVGEEAESGGSGSSSSSSKSSKWKGKGKDVEEAAAIATVAAETAETAEGEGEGEGKVWGKLRGGMMTFSDVVKSGNGNGNGNGNANANANGDGGSDGRQHEKKDSLWGLQQGQEIWGAPE